MSKRFMGMFAAGLAMALALTMGVTGCSTSTTRSATQDDAVQGLAAIKGIDVSITNSSAWPVDVKAQWPNNAGTTKKVDRLKAPGGINYENVSVPWTLNGNVASYLGVTVTPDKPNADFFVDFVFFNQIFKPSWYVGGFHVTGVPTKTWNDTFPVGGQRTLVENGVGLTITRIPDSTFYKNYQIHVFTPKTSGASR